MYTRNLKRFNTCVVNHIRKCSTNANTNTSSAAAETIARKSSNAGPITFTSLTLMAVVGGGITIYYQLEKEKRAQKVASEITTTGKASLGGPWSLVDDDGIPRKSSDYHGQYQLLYFGFTFCPDICPNELVKMGKIVDELKKKNVNIKPIFISVDPSRDTVMQLKEYKTDFHKDMVFLTGTREQIAKATRAYRVYFSKANEHEDDEDDYLVDHSIVMYLLTPDGQFAEFFTQKMQVADVVDKVTKICSKK